MADKVVVVAVKALREIPRWALVWALTHVVQPGDCIMLLVVIPPHDRGKKKNYGVFQDLVVIVPLVRGGFIQESAQIRRMILQIHAPK